MTTRRYYANNAPTQTLNASITSGATSCIINGSFSGWPVQFPFFAGLDYGTASAEIVSVTGIAGTTATIVRAQGGTAAISHTAGATFDHEAVAQDLDEANAHTSSNAGVHGVSGALVGTTDVQTLTNKTLTSPTMTGTVNGAAATYSGTVQSATSTVTGNATAGSYTANANGAATGVLVPKSYTNEAAASAALPSPAVGSHVWLTAPTAVSTSAGVFIWTGSAWKSLTQYISGDTGWVNITVNATFAALAGNVPQARLRNGIVYLRGAFSNTGVTATGTFAIGNLPASIPNPPSATQFWTAGSSAAAAIGEFDVSTSTGAIELRTSGTLGAYYQLNSIIYPID